MAASLDNLLTELGYRQSSFYREDIVIAAIAASAFVSLIRPLISFF